MGSIALIDKPLLEEFSKSMNELLDELNKAPEADKVQERTEFDKRNKTNKHISYYLPISHVQMELDKSFLGLWSTNNFKQSVLVNEILGSIELSVFHPKAQTWITRTGAAAIPIQQLSGSGADEINKKIKNALVKNYPALLAMCLISAAQSFGKKFGRDLNREFTGYFDPDIKPEGYDEAALKNENNLQSFKNKIQKCTKKELIKNIMAEAKKIFPSDLYSEIHQIAAEKYKKMVY